MWMCCHSPIGSGSSRSRVTLGAASGAPKVPPWVWPRAASALDCCSFSHPEKRLVTEGDVPLFPSSWGVRKLAYPSRCPGLKAAPKVMHSTNQWGRRQFVERPLCTKGDYIFPPSAFFNCVKGFENVTMKTRSSRWPATRILSFANPKPADSWGNSRLVSRWKR